MPLSLADVDRIAAAAHAGQFDKTGVPYIGHPRAVAAGLAPFGVGMQMAGLLHDVLEDTAVTGPELRRLGVPGAVVELVELVTSRPQVAYPDMIELIALNYGAALVKVADNAHNSRPDRTGRLPQEQRARLGKKYAGARAVLWRALPGEDVATVLRVVNPWLLPELEAFPT